MNTFFLTNIINGKRDDFTRDDLNAVGREMNIKSNNRIIDEIIDAVSNWPGFAKDAGAESLQIEAIAGTHRLL